MNTEPRAEHDPGDWEDFEAAAKRPIEQHIRNSFIKTYKPVLDDAKYRAFIEELRGEFTAATVKQHLAALRMLFDWLVTGHVLDVNPAHAVRGPKYVVKKGKTPELTADKARGRFDCIAIARNTTYDGSVETDEPALIGLRDRAC